MHTVFTIGHGRLPFEEFLANLKRHEVGLLIDVRSYARSRWPQYNGAALERALLAADIGYEHLPDCGGKLAAMPQDLSRGIDRILELADETTVAIMCSEGKPLTTHVLPRANCHRTTMLSIPLKKRGADVIHILPDGSVIELDEERVPSEW
ncbi:MAG: DUF488 domain-containing protein [bacterium]|nr:DUF488 domain-containing protein [Candidatus Kapabacteria bacterium]